MAPAILSLIVLTALFWALHKAKIFSFCPICAASVLTWAGGLGALYFGKVWIDPLMVAVLSGATVGAIADRYGTRWGMLGKTAFVLLGSSAAYFFVKGEPLFGLGSFLALTIILVSLNRVKSQGGPDLFKDCC